MSFTLEQLNAVILERAKASPDESYTAKLLSHGVEKCAQKLGEEAVEAVIAATKRDNDELTGEAADVLYHLLVLLAANELSLDDVMDKLASRTNQTGLQEKASRTQ